MLNRRRVWATLTVIFVLAGLAGAAKADFKPRVTCGTVGDVGSIVINGRNAIRFQAQNGSLSAVQRAQITTDRLAALVGAKFDPTIIRVEGNKSTAKIYAGDKMICVATAKDAKLAMVSAVDLANAWASNMRELLAMPPVILSDKDIVIPIGENRSVVVTGAAVGPICSKPADADMVDVAETGGRKLLIAGKKLGRTTVDISVDDQHVSLTVDVKKYAGALPNISVGEVTGDPCPSSVISYAAREAIAASAALESNAALEIGDITCSDDALPSGKTRQAAVSVRMTGPDLIPVSGKFNVEIRNIAMACDNAAQLFYSNDPESITKYQQLFAGKLDLNKTTRVLYHHQNMMRSKVHFIVELVNPNDTPAKVRVFRGVSPPSVDTIVVGHVAACAFMKDCVNDVSVMEVIPAQSRVVLVSDTLGYKQTASGILQVTQLSGSSAFIRITAAEPRVDNVSRGSIARAPDTRALRLSDDIYPEPTTTLNAEYVCGSRWAFIPIGKHALTVHNRTLYGNYGVTYKITVKASNPTTETKKVSLVFDPTAGPASAVFIIDGKFALVKYAQPPNEITLATFTLQPGQSKTCHVETVPLAGSNYPATLIVRS